MAKKELAVGDSTQVEIIFKTGHYKGTVRKSATVKTNASNKAERLQIQATILKEGDTSKPLIIEPMAVQLDEIRPDDPYRKWKFRVSLRNISGESVSPHLVVGPSDLFKIKLPRGEVKPGEEEFIEFEFDKGISDELFTKSMTIALDDADSTRYTIPITKSRRWGPTRAGL